MQRDWWVVRIGLPYMEEEEEKRDIKRVRIA
jgi:hypothetical protein